MQRIQIDPDHPDPRLIRKAVEVLRGGGVIAYPTDTVYGIGCDITQKKAVDRVYQLKRMKPDQPLAFLCPDLGDLSKWAIVDDRTYRLMRRLTPGPYCFILQATREAPRILHLSKKRKQVGIRVPHHEVALALVRELGNPVVLLPGRHVPRRGLGRARVLDRPRPLGGRRARRPRRRGPHRHALIPSHRPRASFRTRRTSGGGSGYEASASGATHT
jgi:tRNA threonylcarbamoyl adenosine modification protein (Sua5/YciO/YrdC/YwlC family)